MLRLSFVRCAWLLTLLCLSTFVANAQKTTGRDPYSAYLFVYFTGNGAGEEAIRFAASPDGFTYKALNYNQPVLASADISMSGGVRDPHILRGENGVFYMVVTDMHVAKNGWGPNEGMVLLKSKDLTHWQSNKVHMPTRFPKWTGVNRVWAPQTIYDPQKKKYLIYWSMRKDNDPDVFYYAYANADFTDLETEPQVLYASPGGKSCIDADIILKGGQYHLFYKTEGSGNGIKQLLSTSLTGPYDPPTPDPYLQQTKDAVEGAGVFKLNNSDTYVLMYDVYTKGRYEFAESTDLVNFKKIDGQVSMNFTPRHGTVLPITTAELRALTTQWGTTKPQRQTEFKPGEVWLDTKGEVINAHGGGLLYDKDTYYWFGEKRGKSASEGVNVYSSKDLYNWKMEGLALAKSTDTTSEIATKGLMERPKVIYNPRTKQYVMWFHLELPGKGYSAARAGVAVSKNVIGPYTYLKSFRPNGHMSRDMTLFVDDDGSAYHVYSARENYDLRIVKLTDDYLSATTQDTLLFSNHREAPALFRKDGKYYLITSGCTGWAPNRASLHVAKSLFGPWTPAGDPMRGPMADKTFDGQSTYILPVQGKKDAFIFIADRWNPKDLKDSRYLWLPVSFVDNQPVVEWTDAWNLDVWKK